MGRPDGDSTDGPSFKLWTRSKKGTRRTKRGSQSQDSADSAIWTRDGKKVLSRPLRHLIMVVWFITPTDRWAEMVKQFPERFDNKSPLINLKNSNKLHYYLILVFY